MPDSSDVIELVLENEARRAVVDIARLLGDESEEVAVQRALGTELYLLQQVKGGAKVYLHFRGGDRAEIDLFG